MGDCAGARDSTASNGERWRKKAKAKKKLPQRKQSVAPQRRDATRRISVARTVRPAAAQAHTTAHARHHGASRLRHLRGRPICRCRLQGLPERCGPAGLLRLPRPSRARAQIATAMQTNSAFKAVAQRHSNAPARRSTFNVPPPIH
eukprot:3853396-Prymnesium_polylepis.1